MTKELAIAALNYLTGKGGDLTPLDKDQYISSSSLDKDLSGASVNVFTDNLLEIAIEDMDKKAKGWVSYDVLYGFERKGKKFTIIINITDFYEISTNDRTQEDFYDILNRKINSVVIENGEAAEIDLADLKSQLDDYEALHERIYEAINTAKWSKVFNWDGIDLFKHQQHTHWNRFKGDKSKYEYGGTMPSFSEFHKQTKSELKKYLQQRQSVDFILSYIEGKLDTAHLYGLQEGEKLEAQKRHK